MIAISKHDKKVWENYVSNFQKFVLIPKKSVLSNPKFKKNKMTISMNENYSNQSKLFKKKRFKPDFPGGSPYITVVGGTNFHNAGIGEEEVWNDGGGGFSDNFPIPQYQAKMVAAYKANKNAMLPAQSMWNNTGRGYPDIAALESKSHISFEQPESNITLVADSIAALTDSVGVDPLFN